MSCSAVTAAQECPGCPGCSGCSGCSGCFREGCSGQGYSGYYLRFPGASSTRSTSHIQCRQHCQRREYRCCCCPGNKAAALVAPSRHLSAVSVRCRVCVSVNPYPGSQFSHSSPRRSYAHAGCCILHHQSAQSATNRTNVRHPCVLLARRRRLQPARRFHVPSPAAAQP